MRRLKNLEWDKMGPEWFELRYVKYIEATSATTRSTEPETLLDLFHYTTFLPYLPCLLPYLPAFRIFFSSFSRAGAPFGPLFENRPLLSYFGKKKR